MAVGILFVSLPLNGDLGGGGYTLCITTSNRDLNSGGYTLCITASKWRFRWRPDAKIPFVPLLLNDDTYFYSHTDNRAVAY